MSKKSANERALKAAQGKSLAPKGYKPDTQGRENVNYTAGKIKMQKNASRKDTFHAAASHYEPGAHDWMNYYA